MGAHVSAPLYQRSVPQRYRLEGKRCTACGELDLVPAIYCRRCRSDLLVLERLSGAGTVVAVTLVHPRAAPPELAAPADGYLAGIVELDEGPRISAELVRAHGSTLEVGDRVHVVFRRLYEDRGVVRYGYKFELQDHELVDEGSVSWESKSSPER